MIIGLVVCAVLLAVPLHDLLRRPSLRRFALRNLVRRRGEALLVVGGSLLGTAIITAALVVGTTFETSVKDIARTQLGPIDERVVTPTAAARDRLARQLQADPVAGTDGVLPVSWTTVSVSTVGTDRRAEAGLRLFELDVAAARRFGGNGAASGFEGVPATPAGRQVILNDDLAGRLHVAAGDRVEVFAYGRTLPLTVRQVVPKVGVAGVGSLFVAPGTVEALGRAEGEPVHTEVLVSNQGGVFDGVDRSRAVTAELRQRTRGDAGTSVEQAKRDLVDHAVASGRNIGSLFTLVGLFSVIAGVLLLVNLFVMLAEERKPELGMLRAIGSKRNLLLRAFALEGASYGVVASVLGVALGSGLGWVMVQFTKGLFTNQGDDLVLRFSAPLRTQVAGGAIGLAILLATAYATSARVARLNVISAIRDLPDPRHRQHRLRRLVLGAAAFVVGGFATAVGLTGGGPMLALLGPVVVCAAAVPLVQGFTDQWWVAGAVAAVVIAWCLSAFTVAPGATEGGGVAVFAAQGLLLVTAAVVVAAHIDRLWVLAIEHLGRLGAGLSARLGLAYPLARRFRTGLLLGMYALVMFTITFLATFGHILSSQEPRFADSARAGTDLVVDSNPGNPLPRAVLARQPQVVSEALLLRAEGKVSDAGHAEETTAVTGFDPSLIAGGVPTLAARAPGYSSDADAFRAVLDDPSIAIIDVGLFGQRETGPQDAAVAMGSTVRVTDPDSGASRTLRVVGRLEHDPVGNGVLVSDGVAKGLFGPRAVPSRWFVTVAAGADPMRVAQRLNADLVSYGAEARSFRRIVHDGLSTQLGLFTLMEGYLGLGLVIGIAGLGVVMIRAVRERRHEIGMLRALGFPVRVVRRAFLVESTYIAAQGVLIGLSVGLVTAHQILTSNGLLTGEPLPFSVPWLVLGVVAVVPVLGSVAVAVIPARRAAGIRPAVALRLAD